MKKPCIDCGNLIATGFLCTRCEQDRPARTERNRNRPNSTQRGYDRQWRNLQKQILERDGNICAYCGGHATTVDHVIPLTFRPDLRLDADNLVAACARCNSGKGSR